MKYQDSSEMYIKTIYLLEQEHGHVHITDISRVMKVTKPSVTKATDVLKSRGLIEKEGYGPVILTEKGNSLAQAILHRHEIIEAYLSNILRLDADEAEENACRMEHVVTDAMIDAMAKTIQKRGE